jgi:acyl-CoA thioesterase FadM
VPRFSEFKVAADTSQFTPLQLQPRTALHLGFNCMSRWLVEYLVPHRHLVTRHHTGFVVWGLTLEYHEPVSYFDLDWLELKTGARLRNDGAQLQFDIEFKGGGAKAADLSICLAALWISESEELSGLASKVEGELLARFQPDELDPSAYVCPVPETYKQLQSSGKLLAEGKYPFTVYRHLCEVADQWFFAEVAGFVGASRESLALSQGDRVPQLRKGMSLPLRKVDMMYTRPYYLLDAGVVETRLYSHQDRLVYTHQLLAGNGAGQPYCTVVEFF